METQLVRLDKPYNLICSKDAKFGLHIATLMVIKESPDKKKPPLIHSYPVIEGARQMGGTVWTGSELKDCLVIGRQNKEVTMHRFRDVMRFCHENGYPLMQLVPSLLSFELVLNNMKVALPTPTTPKECEGIFEEELIFKNVDGETRTVYSNPRGNFFFFSAFIIPSPSATGFTASLRKKGLLGEEEAINSLRGYRSSYLNFFWEAGVKDIRFFTNNKDYQDFVDKLNGGAANGD